MHQKQAYLSMFFAKDSIGVVCFQSSPCLILCSSIYHPIYNTHKSITHLINTKNVTTILTNNDTNKIYYHIPQHIKIIKIGEKAIKEDIIESNLNMLRLSPLGKIKNKEAYIKQMVWEAAHLNNEKQKIKSLGILLYYLFNEGNFRLRDKIFLDQIQYFTDRLLNMVIITDHEFQSLQIIKQEIHPSFIKGKGRSKEGFSVLNLYESTLVSQGSKKIMRNIFRNPIYNRKILSERMQTIRWIMQFFNDQNSFIKIFKSIHSLETILKKFNDSRVQLEDWRKLANTVEAMIILSKIINQKVHLSSLEIPSLIHQYLSSINWNHVSVLLTNVSATLDLKNGGIKRGVNSKLDQLKKIYDDLPHLLTIYAQQQSWDPNYRIVFITQVGYLIKVPLQIQIQSQLQDQWTLQFTNSSGQYFSNSLTEMLDQEYGDIYGQITDRQKKIIFDLQTIVCDITETLQLAYWLTVQIECFWGVSIVSKGMCIPKFSSQGLIIAGGWHILLAQDAIDNHVFSFNHDIGPTHKVCNSEQNVVNTNYSNRIMVISGPNASGKTIFLKQTTIIIYLTHLGFLIPADFAQIPLIDKIVLVQPTQSIYQQINGFQSQIFSLSRITTSGLITNKSLVLIDQLGTSINIQIAMKLFGATINYLADENNGIKKNQDLQQFSDRFNMPLCLMITHLTQIIASKIIKENYYIRFLTMSMEKDRICLYKIRPGLVKKGYGINCAKSILGTQIAERATQIWQKIHYKY